MLTRTRTSRHRLRHSPSARQDKQSFPFLRLPAELRNKMYVFAFAGYEIWLRITGKAHVSGPRAHPSHTYYNKRALATGHVCRQLRAETRLQPFEQCPVISNVPMMIIFLDRLDSRLLNRITQVKIILDIYSDLKLPVSAELCFLLGQPRTLERLQNIMFVWTPCNHGEHGERYTTALTAFRQTFHSSGPGHSVQMKMCCTDCGTWMIGCANEDMT